MGRRSTGRSILSPVLGAIGAIVLTACSPQVAAQAGNATDAAQPARHPVSGLAVIPLTVTAKNGKHAFRVEVADTMEAQRKGLMFRTELPDNEGMIFPYDGTTAEAFWMKNTVIPLDIIFIGPDHTISNIGAMATPYSLDPIYSVGSVLGVLELRGGRAKELGIEPGDKVEW